MSTNLDEAIEKAKKKHAERMRKLRAAKAAEERAEKVAIADRLHADNTAYYDRLLALVKASAKQPKAKASTDAPAQPEQTEQQATTDAPAHAASGQGDDRREEQ